MRLMLDTVSMQRHRRDRRGREGRGADALQRRGGRERPGARRRRRGRPARGHAADGARHAERDRGDRRSPSAGRCSSPARRSTWTRSPSGRRRPTRSTSTRRRPRTFDRVAKAKGMHPEDVSVVVLDRDRHESLIAELREAGAKVRLITDGDVAPSIAAARPGTGRGHADGRRRDAGGRDLGGGDQVPRRRDPGQALAARRRGAAGAGRRAASTSTACSRRTTSSPARMSSSPPPASRTARFSTASGTRPAARRPSRS